MKRGSWGILFITIVLTSIFYIYYGWGIPAVKRFPIEPKTKLTATTDKALFSNDDILTKLSVYPLTEKMISDGNDFPVIPGLIATRSYNILEDKIGMCTTMTPQGVTVAGDYLISSAYDHDSRHQSVLYVQDIRTHKLLKTIILKGTPHVGGITYDADHQQLWVCGRKNRQAEIFSISMEAIKKHQDKSKHAISYHQEAILGTISRASYITYHKNSVFVGFFNPSRHGYVQRYTIDKNGQLQGKSLVNQLHTQFTVLADAISSQDTLKQIQGITFFDGYGLLSQSYGPGASKLYVFKEDRRKKIYHEADALAVFKMPSHLEQLSVGNGKIYFVFESAANAYKESSEDPVDRILSIDQATLKTMIKEAQHEK